MEGVFFIFTNALLGLLVGSFLNVLILRRDTGHTIFGRSACMSCGKTLSWYELIPIASWVIQRRRCRSCGSLISFQYPLVEGTAFGAFAMVAAMGLPLTLHVVALLATSMLIAISVYDIRHTIIPDVWAYSFAMVALLFGALSFWPITSVYEAVLFFAAGPFIALPLWAFWFFSRGVWMGLGDAKLALGIGWLLGLPAALEALLLSFVIGALVSVFLLIIVPRFTVYVSTVIQGVRLSFNQTRRTIKVVAITRNISAGLQDSHRLVRGKWNMQSEVPFGPFLVAGCFIVWFLYGIGIATPLIFW